MQVHTIIATFNDIAGVAPVVAVGRSFAAASEAVNIKLSRRGPWIHLSLPEGDASVIRSTTQGNIRFSMEVHEL